MLQSVLASNATDLTFQDVTQAFLKESLDYSASLGQSNADGTLTPLHIIVILSLLR